MTNTPNYQGVFLRGHGSQTVNHGQYGSTTHSSGSIGAIQGDAIRAEKDTTTGYIDVIGYSVSGAFRYTSPPPSAAVSGGPVGLRHLRAEFDPFYNVPKAEENRPINTAVRYLIRAKE